MRIDNIPIANYLKIFPHIWSDTKELARNEDIPHYMILFNFIRAWLMCGLNFTEYRKYNICRYRFYLQKRIFSSRKFYKITKQANNQAYIHFLVNKKDFNSFFSEVGCVRRHWLCAIDMTKQQLNTLLSECKEFLVKPIDGEMGHGIESFLSATLNADDFFEKYKGKDLILEERLYSADEIKFGTESLNTIRIYTLTGGNGKSTIFRPVLRVGAVGNVVDNFHAGGSIYSIEPEYGIVESSGVFLNGKKSIIHPQTNQIIIGTKIPRWDEVKELVLKAAQALPQCQYIGWDVAVTNDGVEIIEGNDTADNELTEELGRPFAWKEMMDFYSSNQ